MRFVHTADWQLGMTRYFLNGEAQPRYSAARRDVVAGLKALADDTGAEFVVVAGDVFEHNQLAPRDVSQSLEAMRAIGVPVYLLPGNHDPLDASSVYTSPLFIAECPANVKVLDRPGVHEVRPGVQLVAAPWTSKAPCSDPVASVRVEPHKVGRWRFVTLRRSVDSSRDIADLDLNLDLMPDKERTVVRIGLTGSLTVTDKAALDACLDKYAR